ncbi:MAG: hypothetical protein GY757_01190 [bacterium]|nr:hypothetical protein [bacterium]
MKSYGFELKAPRGNEQRVPFHLKRSATGWKYNISPRCFHGFLRKYLLFTAILLCFGMLGYSATYTVDTFIDQNDGVANGTSLRDAIIFANGSAGPHTINLPAGTYNLTIAGVYEELCSTGDLDIREDITINVTSGSAVIDGSGLTIDRIFHVAPTPTSGILRIADLTLQNTVAQVDGAAIYVETTGNLFMSGCTVANNTSNYFSSDGGTGGGIQVDGAATINNCAFNNNISNDSTVTVAVKAGALCSWGNVTVNQSTFFNNQVTGGNTAWGGAIFSAALVTLNDCDINGNSAEEGAGLYSTSGGTINMTRCLVRSNVAAFRGGGLYIEDSTLLTNCTITGNQANGNAAGLGGGGIFSNSASAVNQLLLNCTVYSNTAPNQDCGGLYVGSSNNVLIQNTIIAQNTDLMGNYPDIYELSGLVISRRYNIIGDNGFNFWTGGVGDQVGVHGGVLIDPMLGALTNNSGYTMTHALLAGSPAIDQIPVGAVGLTYGNPYNDSPADDQRLISRPLPVANNCDVGAFEYNPAPIITSITPIGGTNDGIISITNLAGDFFLTGATVVLQMGAQPDIIATGIVVIPPNQIICDFDLTGVAVGAWDVEVTNIDNQAVGLAGGFSVTSTALTPTITSITPNSGINNSIVSITNLAGSDFQTGATIRLQMTNQPDIVGTTVNVTSPNLIRCDFDLTGAVAGARDVYVENPGGENDSLAGAFLIMNPAPTITSVSPNSGSNNESVTVTLTGTNFEAGTLPSLQRADETDIAASAVTLVSSTTLTCAFNLNGATAGSWNLYVENADEQTGSLADAFTITPPTPTITSISPASGANNASVTVTIDGTNFLAGITAALQRTRASDIAGTGVTVVSSTRITCTFDLIGATLGSWDVFLLNSNGRYVTFTAGFLVTEPAPTVSVISPASGVNNGTVTITVTGTWFQTGAMASLQKEVQTDKKKALEIINASSVTVVSGTQLICVFNINNAAAGAWDFVVENPDEQSFTFPGAFTVNYPPPTATAISPNTGLNNGSVSITHLAGTYFRSGAQVSLRKDVASARRGVSQLVINATSVVVVSANKITLIFDLNGAEAGTWDLYVENSDGQNHTLPGVFTIANPPPTITSITPGTGTNDGLITITNLAGSYFLEGAEVKLKMARGNNRKGGAGFVIPATGVVVLSSTQITCTFNLSNALPGVYALHVLNPDGQGTYYPDIFTITYPSPTIGAITPNSGYSHEIVQITALVGSGFRDGILVKLTRAGQPDIPAYDIAMTSRGINRNSVVKFNGPNARGMRSQPSPTVLSCYFDLTGAEVGEWHVHVENNDGQSYTMLRGFLIGEKAYSLNVTAIPSARGSVTISPYKPLYHHGETVTLRAVPNSPYTFHRWGGDVTAGQMGTNPITVTMDDITNIEAYFGTPPTVAIATPADGAWVTGTVAVRAEATGTDGISKVEFYIDGLLAHTALAHPYTYNWNTSGFEPGAHSIAAKAYDNYGISSIHSITVYRDSAPSLFINAPRHGDMVHGAVEISATATDDHGIADLKFYIDGDYHHTISAATGVYSWDSTPFDNGIHQIKVKATDSSGLSTVEKIGVNVVNVNLALTVTREEDTIWVVKKEYGRLVVALNNRSIDVDRYIIYRKEGNGEYRELRPASGTGDLAAGGVFYDKYLEKGVSYTYKIHAFDTNGMLVGISDEKSI